MPRLPSRALLAIAVVASLAACGGPAAGTPGHPHPAASAAVTAAPSPPAGSTASPVPPPPSLSAEPTPSASGSPSPSAGSPSGCPPTLPAYAPPGVTLLSCFTLSGEVVAQGGFADSYEGHGASSCVSWAAAGQPGSSAPAASGSPAPTPGQVHYLPDPGEAGVTVNGEPLSFSFSIDPYSGPGSYGGSAGPAAAAGETASYGTTIWDASAAGDFVAQVSGDGSGNLTAHLLDRGTGATETVTESWSCVLEPKL